MTVRLALLALIAAGLLAAGCGSQAVLAGPGTSGGHGILFVRQGHAAAANWEPNGPVFLWRAGAPLRQLTKTQAADRPQWSPDGRKIVYVAAALVGNGKWNGEGPCQSFGCDYEIWVMRADGGGRREVTRDVGNASDVASANSPSWSPSGGQIVYSRSYYNQFDDTLAVVSPGGGRERALKVDGQYPVWGADGIAYLSYGHGIQLLDPRTGTSKPFAPAAKSAVPSAWSKDGWLAAVAPQGVAIYSSSGRLLRRLAPPNRRSPVCAVTWSPGGKRLLITAGRQPRQGWSYYDVYEVDPAGKHWKLLPIHPSLCTTSWR